LQKRKKITMATEENVVLENDDVVVRKIKHSEQGRVSSAKRRKRLIVYLKDAHVRRTEGGHHEEIRRKAGDVVWRPGSEHAIELIEGGDHEVLIIELKN
jgi:hypothetical protein